MDDDEFEDWPQITGTGNATPNAHPVADDEPAVGCIYVPDVESRSGWGMRMVYRKPNEPPRRTIGFRR